MPPESFINFKDLRKEAVNRLMEENLRTLINPIKKFKTKGNSLLSRAWID